MFEIGADEWPGISKLTEECGEVLHIVGKLIGSKGVVEHWDGTNLKNRLEEELGDLLATIEFVMIFNPKLQWGPIYERKANKLALFNKWHYEHSAETLRPEEDLSELQKVYETPIIDQTCGDEGHKWIDRYPSNSHYPDYTDCLYCGKRKGY